MWASEPQLTALWSNCRPTACFLTPVLYLSVLGKIFKQVYFAVLVALLLNFIMAKTSAYEEMQKSAVIPTCTT